MTSTGTSVVATMVTRALQHALVRGFTLKSKTNVTNFVKKNNKTINGTHLWQCALLSQFFFVFDHRVYLGFEIWIDPQSTKNPNNDAILRARAKNFKVISLK